MTLLIVFLVIFLISILPVIFIETVARLIRARNDIGIIWLIISVFCLFMFILLTSSISSIDFYDISYEYKKINQFIIENPKGCIVDSKDKISNINDIITTCGDYNDRLGFYKDSYKEDYYGWLWFLRPDTLIKYPEFQMQDTIINGQYIIKIRKEK